MRSPPRAHLLAWLLLALVVIAPCTSAATSGVATIDRAEAVPSGWQATAPPEKGWVPVTLLDYWNKRWPHHDGVVWYRVRWNQADADAPVGLLLAYVNMADEVWINGSLRYRDSHLVEPLSRSWNTPQYFLVDKPVLRTGENTLLVRVSGLSHYRPGFGPVRIGDPATIRKLYRHAVRWRFDIHLFNLSLSLLLGALFGLIWLLRRKDTVYGWYALSTLLGAVYGWNYISISTWPFASTDARQAFIAAVFAAVTSTFAIFLWRFREQHHPRLEAVLGLFCLSAFVLALLAPHVMGPHRNVWIIPAVVIYYTAIAAFLWHAVRTPRADIRVLGVCLLLPVVVSFHDFAVYMEWWRGGNGNIDALTSPLLIIGMGFVVAWRFSRAMRRIEGFNAELEQEVHAATAKLAETLSHQHALELAHTRAGERLNFVRDLHDGFGGSLLGAIAELEQSPPTGENARTVALLKELRDDLHLVIDTTTHAQDLDLASLLAPLRRRWSQRLDAAGIDNHWRVHGLEGLRPGSARCLDVLRFMQEALTNVFKHSGAGRVEIFTTADGEYLHAEVRDDGRGFDAAAHGRGAGLASLRVRAARLGGKFTLCSAPTQGATLRLDVPLPPA